MSLSLMRALRILAMTHEDQLRTPLEVWARVAHGITPSIQILPPEQRIPSMMELYLLCPIAISKLVLSISFLRSKEILSHPQNDILFIIKLFYDHLRGQAASIKVHYMSLGALPPPATTIGIPSEDLKKVFKSSKGRPPRGCFLLLGDPLTDQIVEFVKSSVGKMSPIHRNYDPCLQYVPEKYPPQLEADLKHVLNEGIRSLGYNTENKKVSIKLACLATKQHAQQPQHVDEDPRTVARLGRLDRSKPFHNVMSFVFLIPASDAGTDIALHSEYDRTGE